MKRSSMRVWIILVVFAAVLLGVTVPLAMWYADAADREQVFEQVEQSETTSLSQSLADLRAAQRKLAKIRDYRCTFVKQERVNGVLRKQETMLMKIRHQPFSVYLRYLSPDSAKGREAIYVEGQNDGKLLGHGAGLQAYFGTMALEPDSMLATSGNRHPITSAGMQHLVEKLLYNYQEKIQPDALEVAVSKTTLNDRDCRVWKLAYPEPQIDSDLAVARVYFDRERQIPIKYELYTWDEHPSDPPILLESYEYQDVELNVGLSDEDFDPTNPEYDFHSGK